MKNLWTKITAWATLKLVPWLKTNWLEIINIIVLFVVYAKTDSLIGLQTIVGLWIFVLLAYEVFYKLFIRKN